MYKKLILLLILVIPFLANAQRRYHEIGLFGGVAYYMGDINQRKLFYSVEPTVSFIYKINLNSRYGLRFNATLASLSGSDTKSENNYQLQRDHSFSIPLTEFATLFEFNFLPYKPQSQYEYFSPYIVIGLGVMIFPADEVTIPVQPVIPFGIGIKYAINKRLGIAAEWSYRKTFTDYLDQLPADTYTETASLDNKQTSYSSSKDWYSFAGISFTYKFAFGSSKCPAYGK